MVELWLSEMTKMEVQTALRALPTHVKALAVWGRQGAKKVSITEKIEAFTHFLKQGGTYIDCDLTAEKSALDAELIPKTALIVSYHNYDDMPSAKALISIIEQQKTHAPAYLKMAVTAQTMAAGDQFLEYLETLQSPIIATVMGPHGAYFRKKIEQEHLSVAAFYALSPEFRTASGQPVLFDEWPT